MFQLFYRFQRPLQLFSHFKGRSSFSTRKVDTPALPKPESVLVLSFMSAGFCTPYLNLWTLL
jgi:hypothetical protein